MPEHPFLAVLSFMASCFSLQLPYSFYFTESFGSKRLSKASVLGLSKLDGSKLGNFLFFNTNISAVGLFARFTSSSCVLSRVLSSMAPSEETGCEEGTATASSDSKEMEFNRVDHLVWVLHESASSFSLAVQSLELGGSGAELSMAWNGKDVHQWHKRIAYQVAVYALFKTAIEVEILLSHDRHSNPSPVKEIFTPMINLLGEYIENQLNMKHPKLVQWFRVSELPRIESFFIPLLKKWSMEYAGSGVAGIIIAISCCAAIGKLGSGRISCPLFSMSIEDVLVELMDLSHSMVEVDKLHKLATEAGFEQEFLTHFGAKILPCNKIEELELWIGLAQQKLSAAFQKEIFIKETGDLQEKVQADRLATLGLFAYLGRKTRLFLSRMGFNDLDEMVKDFLGYLECGIIFIYPELSSVPSYQSFMEVVSDEIGWLDFYAECSCLSIQERERSKQHAIQAEKEIFLSTVFTVCYDVFSGFAHLSRSTQQTLDSGLLPFLLRSQSLLTICLEEYWAVYDRSWEPPKMAELGAPDDILSLGTNSAQNFSLTTEAQQESTELTLQGCLTAKFRENANVKKTSSSVQTEVIASVEDPCTTSELNPGHKSLLAKYGMKLASASSRIVLKDLWMGTQLLCVDIVCALRLLSKQLRGHEPTRREKKKFKRTLNDIATIIPITILMLLPVSTVGHAATLAAINKYMPFLIPSPFSSERLAVVKQLKRTRSMEVQSLSKLEDPSSS
ncbi:hypothetical protein Tsubulata_038277 [Turnera subulata]|uniref:Letm1 RBD domain-containing protein n=1 Tax=Turnera subulata TaxID=218843 RepID=A0A9Q0FJY2_9ROSI|nr:hypothetical protein Tsubulata_038277 [Turnera subulata]